MEVARKIHPRLIHEAVETAICQRRTPDAHCAMPSDPSAKSAVLQLRLRVYRGREAALGPGRADLLARVDKTASIAQAAREMGMSYMKAWKLVQSMNASFQGPLVEVQRGGRAGGAAQLSALGRQALELYRRMESASVAATQPFEVEMARLFRPEAD